MRKCVDLIDNFLNSITMYRLVMYGLIILSAQAMIFSLLGILYFSIFSLFASVIVVLLTCYVSNFFFARILKVPTNAESANITALILFLIFAPAAKPIEFAVLLLAGIISMSSKYLLALHKKHIFNPTAIAAVIVGLLPFAQGGATWWVGSAVMVPATFVIGMLVVRKIRRFHVFFSFVMTSIAVILGFGLAAQMDLADLLRQVITSWPLLFFGTIMLTEPLTTPPTLRLRMIYGTIVGIVFGSQFHVGPFYATPELALVFGNIFSFIVSPKQKFVLHLKERTQLAPDIYQFVFTPNQPPKFSAGQYLEWTVPQVGADNRGNRRYFTIASAPTEKEILLGVKIPVPSSSFKKELLALRKDDMILAGQLAGDFTLPRDAQQKFVFIAGGIGITPFRSMIQYLIDTQQKRDIVLFYASPSADDFVYQDIFATAGKSIGLKTIYIVTKAENVTKGWSGKVGHITAQMIQSEVPDYQQRMFYLSGPNAMVKAYQELLHTLEMNPKKVVVDYFPGF